MRNFSTPIFLLSTLIFLRERVLRGKYRIPFYMSTDCENLLKKFLVLNPARRASLEVAAKVVTRSRWVPSEWQPGDRLSRMRRVTGPIVGLFRQALAHQRNS